MARHLVPRNHLLPCNREPERTHDVSGRCPLSSRDHGGISLKQWAAGAPVIGAAPVSSGRPKRPRPEGLSGSGALQLFIAPAVSAAGVFKEGKKGNRNEASLNRAQPNEAVRQPSASSPVTGDLREKPAPPPR